MSMNSSYPPALDNCALTHGNYSASVERAFPSADCASALADCASALADHADCPSISWAMAYPDNNQGNCSAKPYTGIMCNTQLLAWQECAIGSVQDVILLDLSKSEQSEEERERDVARFLHFLRKLIPILTS